MIFEDVDLRSQPLILFQKLISLGLQTKNIVLFAFSGFFAGNFILLFDLSFFAPLELRSFVFEISEFFSIVTFASRLQRSHI